MQLHGLPPLLVAQILHGLQARHRKGSRTDWYQLDRLCQRARDMGVQAIEQLPPANNRDHLTATIQTAARRALLHPDTERLKDTWDMAAFGKGGNLDFTGISQPWLRDAAKLWAFDYLPTRGGSKVTGAVQSRIHAVVRLSDSLRLQRDDGGLDYTRLGVSDIIAFCNRMAFLEATGEATARLRLSTCRMVKVVLDGGRTLGLTRAGQCLAGLPDDFVLRRGQIPDRWDDDEGGKDLPAEVMRVICDGLPLLEQRCGPEARTAVELLIDTGRRPGEICQLRFGCLEYDTDGQPILVYDNIKSRRLGRRLPIAGGTADLITAQQTRTFARFPDTPASELKLIPSAMANPDGRGGLSTTTLRDWHRRWLGELPAVSVATETTVDGRAVAVLLPYDMATINIYAYRHSYAQRHADAGVPVDVLRELMDHRRMDTTQRYYNVGEIRRREAVDRVAQIQFDRHGTRIWRDAKALLDDERVRLAVGEVAVPYGGCSEPSNVSAGGNACPIRFRCVGCGHFRTDASYLPDLEAYLADLLR
jgi:integrase